jgi:hypothetical protein
MLNRFLTHQWRELWREYTLTVRQVAMALVGNLAIIDLVSLRRGAQTMVLKHLSLETKAFL